MPTEVKQQPDSIVTPTIIPGGGAFKIMSVVPSEYRMAKYPDGSVRLQGKFDRAYPDRSGGDYEWRDIPTVQVNESGEEA